MLTTLAISGYRSLRELVLPLGPLNVVTGANGSGKSSLYRALRLLAETATGGAVGTLAREGGLSSVLWAGPEQISERMRRGEVAVEGTSSRKGPVGLRLGFAGDDLGYAIDFGLPPQDRETRKNTAFAFDPQIKREVIFGGPVARPAGILVDRAGGLVRSRSAGDGWEQLAEIGPGESMLSEVGDPRAAPEIYVIRERVRAWRFYDHFRTDADAPARTAQIGTLTRVLAADGRDLAAALQTIVEVGDSTGLAAAVADAFAGASLTIDYSSARFGVLMHQPGLLRDLATAELSDGTLRYLLWIAALLTPRPPDLMVLNEPETSLHGELLAPLARLIQHASKRSQILVVSHARPLVDALASSADCLTFRLEKQLGETILADREPLDRPPWTWPKR
ncbi:MAG: AAA family ATPase [Deltaproteobacteria bacterium]|nr:AAA family ATPase [Nannocystaceae bacterium]